MDRAILGVSFVRARQRKPACDSAARGTFFAVREEGGAQGKGMIFAVRLGEGHTAKNSRRTAKNPQGKGYGARQRAATRQRIEHARQITYTRQRHKNARQRMLCKAKAFAVQKWKNARQSLLCRAERRRVAFAVRRCTAKPFALCFGPLPCKMAARQRQFLP